MSVNLISKDVDTIVAKFVITTGHPQDRTMNAIMLVFGDRKNFVHRCYERYMMLMRRYLKTSSPIDVIFRRQWKINNSSFWHGIIRKFSGGDESPSKIVLDEGHKGSTRMKLYILGMLFGYSHVTHNQDEYEKTSTRRGSFLYAEYLLTKDKYTMKELQRIRMHLPQMWETPEEVNEHGEHYYVQNDRDDRGYGWNKKGIMCKGPGRIEFTKVVMLGNEEVMAAEILSQLSS